VKSQTMMNITTDPIPKLVAKIAIPASTGFFFNTMYNLVDTYFGGRLSTGGLAALSMSFPVFIILLSLGAGISSGAGALIANSIGGGEEEKAKRYHAQALTFALAISIVVSGVVQALLPAIFTLLGATGDTLASALRYARVLVAGGMFFVLNNVLNAGLSARGDTKTYRNVLIVGFLLNIGLDPLFLYGVTLGGVTIIPAMYEGGIALATILIQALSFLYLIFHVRKSKILDGISIANFKPNRQMMREIAGQATPTALSMMTMALGTFVITYYASKYGTDAVAAYGASIRIEQVALVPTIGLNVALATLVGQNNGAKRMDRVTQAFKVTLLAGLFIKICMLTPILIFARPLMKIFSSDPEVIRIGMSYLFIEAVTFYSYVVLQQSNSVLQGLKKPAMIMWVGLYRQIPAPLAIFSLVVFVIKADVSGIWWGLAGVNWSAALFVLFYALRVLRRRKAEVNPVPVDQASYADAQGGI
jgi:putative MATE family efflux protein